MISTWMKTCPLFGVYVSIWNIFAHKSLSFWWPFESWWFDNLNLFPCMWNVLLLFIWPNHWWANFKENELCNFKTRWENLENKVKINLQWKKPWLVYFDYNRCGSKCIKLHPPCLSISVRQMIVLKIW